MASARTGKSNGNIFHFLSAPVFADEEKTHYARLLHTITLCIVLTADLFLTVLCIVSRTYAPRGLVVLATINIIGLGLITLSKNGRTWLASSLLVSGMVFMVTFLALTAGGIRSGSVMVYMVIVLIAGLLLGERAGIFTGIVCILAGLLMVLAEENELLNAQPSGASIYARWIINTLCIVFTIVLQAMTTRTIRHALHRVQSELSERKQTEKQLQKSTERLKLATQVAAIAVWDWNLQTNEILCDNQLFEIYGLKPPPDNIFEYQAWRDSVHPDDLDEQETSLNRTIAERNNSQRMFRIIRPDGEVRYIQAVETAVTDERGNTVRMVGVNIDITAQKKAESERLRLVHDLAERVKELNLLHRAARLLQSSRSFNQEFTSELVKMIPHAWQYPEICEARISYEGIEAKTNGWRETSWKLSAPFSTNVGTGVVEVVYTAEVSKDAENPFDPEEQTLLESLAEMLEAYLNHRDAIAALEQREAEFRAVFEQAAIGVTLISITGYPVKCNAALVNFLGYSESELTQMSFAEFTHPDDLEIDMQFYQAILNGERDHYQIEKRYIRKDKQVVWGRLTVSLVQTSSKNIQYAIGIVEDITARKEAEQDRTRLESQLRQSQKMQAIGTLAGGIAHDFNNILTAIMGNTQLAMSDVLVDNKTQHRLAEIAKAGSRASDLVRRILTFSRQQETIRKVIKLEPIVEEALKLLRASLPAMIEIKTDFAPALPNISADATQIHQVIMNLGTNAAHAMSERGGLLKVRLDVITSNPDLIRALPDLHTGDYIRLTISDNGCGMDKEVLERIFEPFFTTKTQEKGTGLGLSVVHGIVKNHDGAISVSSEPNNGTTFRLYFPAVEETTVNVTQTTNDKIPPGSGERILYVDDEETLVFLMTGMLEHLGYRANGYSDVSQALQAFRSEPHEFDLVITDSSMPVMTGDKFAQELLKIRPDIPVIMASGYFQPDNAESARNIGVREFILKPITIAELGNVLNKVLTSRRS